jgi:hypothetical protein
MHRHAGQFVALRAWVLRSAFVFFACGALQCRRSSPQVDAGPDASRLCASACATLVTAGCSFPGLSEADQPRCVKSCQRSAALARRASCTAHHAAYLECVSRARPDCSSLRCSASTCLEQGTAGASCAEAFARLSGCQAACQQAGTTQLFNRVLSGRRVALEIVRGGCAPCPPRTAAGAGAGAACQSHVVCEQHCCLCAGRTVHYLARACSEGTCLSREEACGLSGSEFSACE